MAQIHAGVATPRSRFHAALKSGGSLAIPGAYDVLSAKLIAEAGFDGVVVTGFGLSASLLGLPDTELYTMTENLSVVRNVVNAVDIPVMADGDTGYGNAINVMRTVREFEATGAASITIEDQLSPKRCPAVSDHTEIVPLEEAVAKIRAAVEARQDPKFTIIARTDARDGSEALRRSLAYVQAGADVIKPISKCFTSLEALRAFRSACDRPLAVSVVGWLARELDRTELMSIGGIVTWPFVPLLTVTAALRQNLAALKVAVRSNDLPVPMTGEADFKQFIGFAEIERLERKFLTGAG